MIIGIIVNDLEVHRYSRSLKALAILMKAYVFISNLKHA